MKDSNLYPNDKLLNLIDSILPMYWDYATDWLHKDRILKRKVQAMEPVNPESIEIGDIISTKLGVARVSILDNNKGELTYTPLNDPNIVMYSEKISIRSISLLAKFKEERQLEFAFVAKEIEEAIIERNIRLEQMKQEIIAKSYEATAKIKVKVTNKSRFGTKKVKTQEELQMEKLIEAMGGIDKVNEALKS